MVIEILGKVLTERFEAFGGQVASAEFAGRFPLMQVQPRLGPFLQGWVINEVSYRVCEVGLLGEERQSPL
ncbi:hypothetical protein D3C71_2204110 [compost metagenome]